jgi:peroxiredoxin
MIFIPVIFALCPASCVREEAPDAREASSLVKAGDEVPDFTVSNDEGTVSKATLAGKKTLLVLFSTACGDCRRALPVVEEAWRLLRDEPGVLVITISREEPAGTVSDYWATAGFTMPYYLDEDRAVFNKFASAYTPRVYLVDPRQRVAEMHVETLPLTGEQLYRRVMAL